MQMSLLEVYLIPTQRDQLGYPQTVPVGQQDECLVTMPVPSRTTGSSHQSINFVARQVSDQINEHRIAVESEPTEGVAIT